MRPTQHLRLFTVASAALFSFILTAQAELARLVVHVNQPRHPIPPTLWGIFFEDINCSADGGLYAELVRNRSFENADEPDYWSVVGQGSAKVTTALDSSAPINPKNPHSLKVSVIDPGGGGAGIANEGFWGIAVKRGETYDLSLWARGGDEFGGPLAVNLEGRNNTVCASAALSRLTPQWKHYKLALAATATEPKTRLAITTAKPGVFWLDMVSLFPRRTWKNRPNGLRPDLAEMLVDLKPAFVRFPGGCWVEGDTMALAYRWKQTIGDISERRTQYNIWRYHATHGLGFHEYLQMCEDLGAEPLFVINCGMSHRENVPLDKMDEFVQDAIDAIEYCNGPVTSPWGALRARHGHPAPFNLKYLEIGNENGGPAYQERYALFHDAVKARYPEITLIANVPTEQRRADIVDEHYYSSPEFFIQQAGRYDKYDRRGPRIYVGEYAVTTGCGLGNLRAALGEAAFMTGIERNSDVVVMASYAPLFVNVNHRAWSPDLINYDTHRAYGTPSYYVQKLFSENRGDLVLSVVVDAPASSEGPLGGAIGVGTWATRAEFKDIRVTRGGETLFTCDFAEGAKGWRLLGGDWKVQDGALRQDALTENVRAIAGDKTWTDYSYSLKARKLGGAEGFLILFRVRDENEKSWWNLGGWGNSRHAIEAGGIVANEVPGRIETGRWYDIRIELAGPRVKCYLDGQLIHDAVPPMLRSLYASASQTRTAREVILKVVNVSRTDQPAEIVLNGARIVRPGSKVTVLTSAKPTDENTLENPKAVAPVTKPLSANSTEFHHVFPGNSVSVMRLKVEL
jgi:alpha-L-arabinofuranosidase